MHSARRNLSLPITLKIAGDWIRARETMPTPNYAVFLAKPSAIEEPLAPVMRLIGSL